jgi:hypothetical protein
MTKTLRFAFAIPILVSGGLAFAQVNQQISPISPQPRQPTGQQELQELRAVPQNANPMLELPTIPKAFDGCWAGLIEKPDYWERLGGPRVAVFYHFVFQICFGRASDGTSRIEFQNHEVDTADAEMQGYPIQNFHAHASLVSTDGKTEVQLHGVAASDCTGRVLGIFPIQITVTQTSDMTCTFLVDRDMMRCSKNELSLFGPKGIEWIKSSWHGDLHRVPNHSSS